MVDLDDLFVAGKNPRKKKPRLRNASPQLWSMPCGKMTTRRSGCSADPAAGSHPFRCVFRAKGLRNQVSIGFMSFVHICSGSIRKKSRCIKDLLFKRCLLSLFAMRFIIIRRRYQLYDTYRFQPWQGKNGHYPEVTWSLKIDDCFCGILHFRPHHFTVAMS